MNLPRYRVPEASWPWAAPVQALEAPRELVAGLQVVSASLAWPFDVMREQHARGVRAGLMACSILESSDFERTLGALEHVTLGPLARRC